jgi:hypothetical protein
MNSRAFGKGSLFETEAFCLSGTSPTDKNSSLRDLCVSVVNTYNFMQCLMIYFREMSTFTSGQARASLEFLRGLC